jgi:hypothetical protein
MMIEKGMEYKMKVDALKKEKASHETDGCSFMP